MLCITEGGGPDIDIHAEGVGRDLIVIRYVTSHSEIMTLTLLVMKLAFYCFKSSLKTLLLRMKENLRAFHRLKWAQGEELASLKWPLEEKSKGYLILLIGR